MRWQQEPEKGVISCDFGALSAIMRRQLDDTWKCSFVIEGDPLKVIDSFEYKCPLTLSSIQNYAEKYGRALDGYLSARPQQSKKLKERVWLEQARRLWPAFPDGHVIDSEEPDFLIATDAGFIGVELTTVWKPPLVSALPAKTIAGNYDSIVKKAKKRFEASSRSPHDVQVMFSGDAELERDPNVLIDRLACFVEANARIGVTRYWEALSGPPNELPSGFAWIGIHPPLGDKGCWHCLHFGDAFPLSYDELARAVAQKNTRLPSYLGKAAVNWLVLVVAFPEWGSPSIPGEVTTWKFASGFQKILLFCCEHGRVLDVSG